MAVLPFTSHAVVRPDVARVILAGELDMDTASHVREAVAVCLRERPARLCLDLTDVSFCDCAGLSALLDARSSALAVDARFAVEGVGTQVARLFSLIGIDLLHLGERGRPGTGPAHHAVAPGRHAAPVDAAESSLRRLLT
ncbi:STAS domain-containing protein [uncultured Streptomyces sp.]|uniref:STAS domain-containing protein n=1 Tax=uncultured Streptomyces sp. TaxID=174707 RepID=UPI00261E2E79|nr:STAS domain-containing protein [uncultured Streptomyces sp.]